MNRNSALNIVAIVVGCIAIIGAVISIYRGSAKSTLVHETSAEKYAESAAAFAESPGAFAGPADEAAAVQEIHAFVQEMRVTFNGTDTKASSALFDAEVMFGSLQQQGLIKQMSKRDRRAFLLGLQLGLSQGSTGLTQYMKWTQTDVRHVKFIAGHHEAIVYVRHVDTDEIRSKIRWWMVRRDGQWKIYDFEDLDTGLRATHLMGAAIGTGTAAAPWTNRFTELHLAIQYMQTEQYDKASMALKNLSNAGLPPAMESLRLVMLAGAEVANGNEEEALAHIDQAERLRPDQPIVHVLRTNIYYSQGEYEKVVEHGARYEALLGNDVDLHLTIGDALLKLDRKAEAAAAFRKGLSDDPDSIDNLTGLCEALGTHGADEIRTTLKAFKQPGEAFASAASYLYDQFDIDALDALNTAMTAVDADHEELAFYQGLAHWQREKYEDAAASFKASLPKSLDDENRKTRLSWYRISMVYAKKALEVYRQITDAKEARAAYREMALWLEDEPFDGWHDHLSQLNTAHEGKYADDTMLPYHRGYVHEWDEDYDGAEKEYTRGWAMPLSDEERRSYRTRLIYVRYQIGKAVSAYNEIGPRDETFSLLAYNCYYDKNAAILEQLIELHRPHSKGPEELAIWEANCASFQGNHTKVINLLRQHREAILSDKGNAWTYRHLLFRSLIRAKRLAEARAALMEYEEEERPAYHRVLMAAASGDSAEAIRLIEAFIEDEYYLGGFYEDEDLGPILQTDAYKAFREKHPRPKDDDFLE